MTFDRDAFASQLKLCYPDTLMLSSEWHSSGTTAGPNDNVIEYYYIGSEQEAFRTWQQETSSPYIQLPNEDVGLFVSCKVDYERPDKQLDDHFIIMTGFILEGNAPALCYAQVIIEYADNEQNYMANFNSGAITAGNTAAGTTISQAIFDAITAQLQYLPPAVRPQNGFGPDVPAPTGWQYFPNIAKANIDSIAAAVSVDPPAETTVYPHL